MKGSGSGRLDGSITIESAYLMIFILFIFGFMIRYCFRTHDRILSGMVLNEALELSGHLLSEDEEGIQGYGADRLGDLLSQRSFDFNISSYKDGNEGSAEGKGFVISMRDKGFRPQKVMRAITLMDGMKDE